MGQYSSYYLYQKYEKRGDQPFVPVYPAVYSVDGDGTREPVVKNENDYQCGWTGETGTLYRWVDLPIDTDYICDECPEVQYRWVTVSGYVCSGTTKYNKEQEQVSYDSGVTWNNMDEYRRGSTIIETESEDCGYAERWVNLPIGTDYECIGFNKFYKQKKQVSYDSGSTWADADPAVYRAGDLYELNSLDCGYDPTMFRWAPTTETLCVENTD